MSLAMAALRIAAVEALKSAGTLVGSNVLDSQIAAIDATADGALSTDAAAPFIAVYTDSATAKDLGHDGLNDNGQIALIFNYGLSVAMADTDKVTGDRVITAEGVPVTDANLELMLDVIDADITRGLTVASNPWAEIFQRFICSYAGRTLSRAQSHRDKVRIAAGQTKLMIEALPDPVLHAERPAGGVWAAFLAQLIADGLPQAPVFERLLGVPAGGAYPEYEALLALPTATVHAMGLYPYANVDREVVVTEGNATAEPAP